MKYIMMLQNTLFYFRLNSLISLLCGLNKNVVLKLDELWVLLLQHFGLFFALLNLLHLAGLIHHFAIDHGLGDDFYNLPGPYIRFFCDMENKSGLIT